MAKIDPDSGALKVELFKQIGEQLRQKPAYGFADTHKKLA